MASFANHCGITRHLIEDGVRVVPLFDSNWDTHTNIKTQLHHKTEDADLVCAALITDLQHRGLLNETLIVWRANLAARR